MISLPLNTEEHIFSRVLVVSTVRFLMVSMLKKK